MAKLSAGSTVGGQQIETTAGAQAKANAVQTNLTNHINNKNNPHGVTKSQVGLGNVDNVKQASKSEFDAHVNNKNNPHNVTSEQISRTTEKSADVPGTSYPKGYSYFSTSNGTSLGYPANLAVVQTIYDSEYRITQYVTDNSSSTNMGKWYRIYRSDTGWSGFTQIETTTGAQAKVNSHANRTDNPHNVTKSQVGLGSVQNYGVASQSQAEAGTASNAYMTPLRTKQAIDALSPVKSVAGKKGAVTLSKSDVGLGNVDNVKQASKTEFDAHVNNKSNPHGVTKSQVGLGSVQNYGIASQSEAEAGSVNDKYMTPLRTKQAIDVQAVRKSGDTIKGDLKIYSPAQNQKVTLRIGDRDDSYGYDIIYDGTGSGNDNSLELWADNQTGSAVRSLRITQDGVVNFLATPRINGTTIETTSGAQSKVNSHANRTDNPHKVTKSQVGLGSVQNYGIATQAEAQAGTVNNKYMTPLRVHEAILALSKVKYIGGITADTQFEGYDTGFYFGHPEGPGFPKYGYAYAMIVIVHNETASSFGIAKGLIITSNNIYVANYISWKGWSDWTALA